MFRSKTVFVVGAGASCELGFPSGPTLLQEIASALDIRFQNGYDMDRGDVRIYESYQKLATGSDGRIGPVNEYQHAGWRVRNAAHLGLSIDNVINQFEGDALVALVAKLAIARHILLAESKSALRLPLHTHDSQQVLITARSTWLGGFCQLLFQDKTKISLDDIFDNIKIISFNYDRSIRRFLPLALESQFALTDVEAKALSKRLQIFYPYGNLAPLPWEDQNAGVPYGGVDHADLVQISKNLRTFTEQIEDGAELQAMRDALNEAERIVFLGFGYHRQNMSLLMDNVQGSATRVYGTALGLSEADKGVVTSQLTHFLRDVYRMTTEPKLSSEGCVKFISEYFRALTS